MITISYASIFGREVDKTGGQVPRIGIDTGVSGATQPDKKETIAKEEDVLSDRSGIVRHCGPIRLDPTPCRFEMNGVYERGTGMDGQFDRQKRDV